VASIRDRAKDVAPNRGLSNSSNLHLHQTDSRCHANENVKIVTQN